MIDDHAETADAAGRQIERDHEHAVAEGGQSPARGDNHLVKKNFARAMQGNMTFQRLSFRLKMSKQAFGHVILLCGVDVSARVHGPDPTRGSIETQGSGGVKENP